MLLTYLGPLCAGMNHPAMRGYDVSQFSMSCYIVEVGEQAGVDGPLIEGDVLVIDESREPQHGDLAVALVEDEQRLYHVFRIGGNLLLIPPLDRSGSIPARWANLQGVVVSQARRYAF